MKILVVEDDGIVAETLKILLSSFQYAVDVAADGVAGWEMAEAFNYDLALLDVMLPELDGLSLCQKLRAKGFKQPILLLTGQGGAHQKAIALNAGADDYVVKPFDPEELVARVQALLRRGGAIAAPVLIWGNLALDPNTQKVTYGTQLLSLTPKEFAILELFLRNQQKAFNAAAIINCAWSSIDCPAEESVRVHIKDLRRKLREASAPKDLIQTVYGRGYRLNPMYSTTIALDSEEPLTPLQIAELKSVNEQLRIALEDLRLTQAELDRKHQELEVAHQTLDRERQELQKARDELEFRVADRTAELIGANSQLKQQQQQLQAVGEHLQLALDAIEAGTVDVDPINGEVKWNDRFYQLLGYAPREVKPSYQAWRDRVHPDDLPRMEQERINNSQCSHDLEFDYRVVHPDGSIHWLLARKHDRVDESGRVFRHLWVAIEIGDRQHLETTQRAYEAQKLALELSDRKFQHFAQRIEAVIWIARTSQVEILYINRAYENIWGRSCQSLKEKPESWFETIYPDDLPIIESKRQQEAQGHPSDVEYRIVRPDGSIRWIWDRGFPIGDTNADVILLGGIAEDITDRKQAEFALQHQLQRAHLVAEVTQAIRQSLDLEQILNVTVSRVRQLLQTDRVVVFRFQPNWEGHIVAESVAPGWSAILHTTIYDPCFKEQYIEPYRKGRISTLSEVNKTKMEECYFDLLTQFEVQANAVVPILQSNCEESDRLWGLLIVHHCASPRQWQPEEIDLLQQLADQLGVAIEQADLFAQTSRELQERQRTESELRNSENRYRLLFDSNPHPIWVIDAENLKFLAANRAAIELYGFSRPEFLRMTLPQAGIFDLSDLPHAIEMYFSSTEQHSSGIWTQIRRDGTRMDVEMSSHAFAFEGKTAYLVLVTDISDRLRAERKIQEQAALLDIASDAILVRDLDQRIIYWNRGAERVYGWSASEAIGQKADVLLQDENSQVAEIMQTILYGGEWRGELSKTAKDGKKVTVEARWTLVRDEAGQPRWILSVNTDISEKKQLEAQFYRAQRLESLGTLASGIAHDLNNVFTPILAISQMLVSKELGKRTPEMLQVLQDSAKRGAHMVGQILTFARGMEGKRIPIQINTVLKELVKVVEATFPKSIEIKLDVDRSLGLVCADSTHLHQILLNLCVNGRDAMPDGGKLTLAAENCYIDELFAQINLDASVGNYVAIAVTDTGTGISPEVQDLMFDPFFTTKSMGQGTGLGLSVVLGMVKNYGGFLEVLSEVGKGTQIKVYLPTIEGETHESQIYGQIAKGRGELILVVDDDLAVGRTNQSLLESYQYRTIMARDGVEAVACYGQHQDEIKAVLIDMMMPNMDGVTAIAAIKNLNPDAKIIAMSGLASYKEAAIGAGASVFLAKPYTVEDLLTHLAEAIASPP